MTYVPKKKGVYVSPKRAAVKKKSNKDNGGAQDIMKEDVNINTKDEDNHAKTKDIINIIKDHDKDIDKDDKDDRVVLLHCHGNATDIGISKIIFG